MVGARWGFSAGCSTLLSQHSSHMNGHTTERSRHSGQLPFLFSIGNEAFSGKVLAVLQLSETRRPCVTEPIVCLQDRNE